MQIQSMTFDPPVVKLGELTTVTVTVKNNDGYRYTHLSGVLSAYAKKVEGTGTYDYKTVAFESVIDKDVSVAVNSTYTFSATLTFDELYNWRDEVLDKTERFIQDYSGASSGIGLIVTLNKQSISLSVRYKTFAAMRESGELAILTRPYAPTLLGMSIARNNGSTLMPSDEGVNAWLNAQWSQTWGTVLPLKLWYKARSVQTFSDYIDIPISGLSGTYAGAVASSGTLVTFSKGVDYDVKLVLGDAFESFEIADQLPRACAVFALSKKAQGGACFGSFPKSTDSNPMLESYYKAYLYAGIEDGGWNYYTQETPCGVWVDGRKIYRKTVGPTEITISTSDTTSVIGVLGETVREVIDMSAVVLWLDTNGALVSAHVGSCYSNPGNNNYKYEINYRVSDDSVVLRHVDYGSGSTKKYRCYATVWYTK